jgi:hypothetical protein
MGPSAVPLCERAARGDFPKGGGGYILRLYLEALPGAKCPLIYGLCMA